MSETKNINIARKGISFTGIDLDKLSSKRRQKEKEDILTAIAQDGMSLQ